MHELKYSVPPSSRDPIKLLNREHGETVRKRHPELAVAARRSWAAQNAFCGFKKAFLGFKIGYIMGSRTWRLKIGLYYGILWHSLGMSNL